MMTGNNAIIKEAYVVANSQNFFDYSQPFVADILFFNNIAGGMNLSDNTETLKSLRILNDSICKAPNDGSHHAKKVETLNNWWAMLALVLVLGTAAGNILVCLAIAWERRLQNVTNYFLMSLAITDFMVAILVMPLGILTLVKGYFPLPAMYCLVWICLDVLFCTASIMHLCTISVDRYLSLRYPMKFGRNKTRRRVTLKILFVWLLSIAMSLPLCLMYSKDDDSVLVDGTCQIPDPLYKLIGSIICFFIPLVVMLITYALTVKLLAKKRENIGGESELNRRYMWKKLIVNKSSEGSTGGTPAHTSAASTDTELTTLDTHDLWLPESEPAPPLAMSALQEFGAELLKLSRGLEGITNIGDDSGDQLPLNTSRSMQNQYSLRHHTLPTTHYSRTFHYGSDEANIQNSISGGSRTSLIAPTKNKHLLPPTTPCTYRRRASTYNEAHYLQRVSTDTPSVPLRKRSFSFHEQTVLSKSSSIRKRSTTVQEISGGKRDNTLMEIEGFASSLHTSSYSGGDLSKNPLPQNSNENEEVSFNDITTKPTMKNLDIRFSSKSDQLENKFQYESSSTVVTWRSGRRGSSTGNTKTSVATSKSMPLRRAATMRAHNCATSMASKGSNNTCSPCVIKYIGPIRIISHSRTSSVISRNSSRHGRIIRLEQKATKVLGVVFFTFVILWAPFFILNLTPVICPDCEKKIDNRIFDFVTWLGYASSMVNPIFYTIFNKVFRQAFKKVILCQYGTHTWRPSS